MKLSNIKQGMRVLIKDDIDIDPFYKGDADKFKNKVGEVINLLPNIIYGVHVRFNCGSRFWYSKLDVRKLNKKEKKALKTKGKNIGLQSALQARQQQLCEIRINNMQSALAQPAQQSALAQLAQQSALAQLAQQYALDRASQQDALVDFKQPSDCRFTVGRLEIY